MFRIIAIDDNPVVVESIKEIIPWNSLGFELAEIFTDSRKAMEYAHNNHVDVILTDIAMEEPDGLEIVRICENELPNIKIILLSAFRNFEFARQAIRYRNVVDYLTKPLNFPKLVELLRSIEENLRTASGYSEFSSEEILGKRLEFFSNLLYQYDENLGETGKALVELGISPADVDSSLSVVKFHIENFDTFVEKTWKYSALKLYYAISNAVPFETKDAYFSLANYAYGNIVWIVIHKKNTNTEKTVGDFEIRLMSTLKEIFGMNLSVNYRRSYANIQELVESSRPVQSETAIENRTIAKAVMYMQQNFSKDLSMKEVADYVYMSPSYFSTYFKKITGKRFIDMLTQIRITNAAKLLEKKSLKVNDVCEMVGYNHMGNFYEKFKKQYNMTPAEYKNKFVRDDE